MNEIQALIGNITKQLQEPQGAVAKEGEKEDCQPPQSDKMLKDFLEEKEDSLLESPREDILVALGSMDSLGLGPKCKCKCIE